MLLIYNRINCEVISDYIGLHHTYIIAVLVKNSSILGHIGSGHDALIIGNGTDDNWLKSFITNYLGWKSGYALYRRTVQGSCSVELNRFLSMLVTTTKQGRSLIL